MHELGIVYHIIDTLEQVAKDNELTHIDSVTMEVGEVSAVIPDYLTDCWAWASGNSSSSSTSAPNSVSRMMPPKAATSSFTRS